MSTATRSRTGVRPSGSVRRPTGRRNSATAKKSSWAGFTLIELVLVLVVFAIAGAIAVPAIMPALESAQAQAAARRTASFLDDARRRSVLKRVVLEVTCRPEEEQVLVAGAADEESAFPMPSAVDLVSCEPEEMRYNPQGSATGMTLTLRDKHERGFRVTVGAFTGLARVESF